MKVYLIGGTTPRTDLDNYEDAFLDKEEAEKCLKWWQREQGKYEDFHIDSIEISEKFDDRDYCNGCINYNEFGRNCTIGVEDIRQCVDYESYDEH